MVTNDERVQKYAEAIHGSRTNLTKICAEDDPESCWSIAPAVMAVADAEQAELRAELRLYHDRAMASEAAEARWQERAEAAEAKVARVEAALGEWGMDDDDAFAEAIRESGGWRLARDLRAALDGDA